MPADRSGRRHPAYLLYRSGQALTSRIPGPLLLPAAEAAGLAIGRLNGRRRAVVRRNMARVVGPARVERAVDLAFRSYARYWAETLRIPAPGLERIAERVTCEGVHHLAGHLDAGRGVLFVTPHVGSWDVAGLWLASQGWRTVAVAERLEPPELFDLFSTLRRQAGIEVHPLGESRSARALLSGLASGAIAALVADRDISGTGVEVEFFGERTFLPSGPAVLARRTGAPLIVGGMFQRPRGRYHGVILEPIEVAKGKTDPDDTTRLTQLVAHRLEELIRRDPGQWHLFQPNWPSDPGYRGGRR
ncbi:MAG TPA: phosphatidylinositol mannoside acyltransferase [Actinomycetota bacterium]|nr:phosphatidylinositol mannoside acyltransferase [Actinomycetota bacterium]